MFAKLIQALEKPSLYQKTSIPFWDDEHISKQMLKAHLDPEFDGASRKIAFIDKSANWIKEIASPETHEYLLDIGCGPGLYAERFSQFGYKVTGVDYSKRSINYAQQNAKIKGLDIHYIHQDYLNMDLKTKYDFSTMIYCDYGALSTCDRKTIMRTIYRHLNPGGKFLLDVFSMAAYANFSEKQIWEICNDGGFWSAEKYIAFHASYKYSETVTLEQTSTITSKGISKYYIWNTYFTRETLIKEAQNIGFKICAVWGDVAGSAYSPDKSTIAILLEK